MASFVLAASVGMGTAGADTVAVARFESGNEQRINLRFGDSRLEVSTIQVTGPHYDVFDEDPYLTEGPSGHGGAHLAFERDAVLACSFSEATPGWSLTVAPSAESATLTSTVPGCEGTIQFAGHGVPGVAIAGAPTDPGSEGIGLGIEVTISRLATVVGSFAGAVPEDYWAQISYTRIFEPGVGVPAV